LSNRRSSLLDTTEGQKTSKRKKERGGKMGEMRREGEKTRRAVHPS